MPIASQRHWREGLDNLAWGMGKISEKLSRSSQEISSAAGERITSGGDIIDDLPELIPMSADIQIDEPVVDNSITLLFPEVDFTDNEIEISNSNSTANNNLSDEEENSNEFIRWFNAPIKFLRELNQYLLEADQLEKECIDAAAENSFIGKIGKGCNAAMKSENPSIQSSLLPETPKEIAIQANAGSSGPCGGQINWKISFNSASHFPCIHC